MITSASYYFRVAGRLNIYATMPGVIALVKKFHDSNKYIFAICHGVQILVTAGLVNQKKVACYEHVKFEVESCGGIYIPDEEAVKDGKIITGKNMAVSP